MSAGANNMDWSSTQPEKMTDIAAIQPTFSNQVEEEKVGTNIASSIMNAKINMNKTAKFCGVDTIVSEI